jgi:hypothetical protein
MRAPECVLASCRHGTSQDIATPSSAQSRGAAKAASGTAHPGTAAGEEAPQVVVIGADEAVRAQKNLRAIRGDRPSGHSAIAGRPEARRMRPAFAAGA